MAADTNDRRLKTRLVPILTMVAGVIVAAAAAGAPADLLSAVVEATGLPAILPAAAPPIGVTGRTLLALVIGLAVGSLGFIAPLIAGFARRDVPEPDAPRLRRADAHPDAPARRPIRASEDLGPPLPMVRSYLPNSAQTIRAQTAPAPAAVAMPIVSQPAIARARELPADLDLPMAAFDPRALPEVPRTPVRVVAPLVPPVVTEAVAPVAVSEPAPLASLSIAALLDRLERGSGRRAVGAGRRFAAG